jgi:hypothetical protein
MMYNFKSGELAIDFLWVNSLDLAFKITMSCKKLILWMMGIAM